MTIARITPILSVSEVEPCVKFWVERMGFKVTAEVPDGNTVGFAMLERDGVELMYQSYHSIENDNAAMAAIARKGASFLYIEVSNLDDVIGAMKGAEIAVPLRTTFYGMKELGVKDPAGHIILFAQKAETLKP
ncbi:MAG TPA: VOC family protein [Candidatus Acidoferrales bacterium]|nr:VOC family protein [Candidatus Acidoferrales bacterium]